MKIVVLDGQMENPGDLSWSGFERLGELTVCGRTEASETIARIGDAEIVITNKTYITREVLDACPGVRYIGVLATGYNVVDLDCARERGIPVTNIPSYGTEAVAQFAIALLLEVCHHVGAHSDAVHAGDWTNCVEFCFWNYPLIELAGKTMGIIGFGNIGRAVGRIANALGMKVLFNSRRRDASLETDACRYADLDELLANSDVVSLHCPLTELTKGIINSASIAKMKDGVIIINNSRGQLIVEQDLADALNSGKVFAAGLDVASKEPIAADNPLLTANNCIITPHISWAPKETRARLMAIAVENLEAFLNGRPQNVVNP